MPRPIHVMEAPTVAFSFLILIRWYGENSNGPGVDLCTRLAVLDAIMPKS